MAATRSFFNQFLDDNGDPLAGGKLYSYEAGTSTPLATYTDVTGSVANSNPVILDSGGRASVWLSGERYKIVLYDANDNLIKSVDNIAIFENGSVVTEALADGAVTTLKLGAQAVTNAKLADDAVTTEKIADDGVQTTNIKNSAVTESKVADGAVTNTKIGAGAVTPDKLSALGTSISSGSGNYSTSSASEVLVTNQSVTLFTTGDRPIEVKLIPDGTIETYIGVRGTGLGDNSISAHFILKKDGVQVTDFFLGMSGDSSNITNSAKYPPGTVNYIDFSPTNGSNTYSLYVRGGGGGDTMEVYNCRLLAKEL